MNKSFQPKIILNELQEIGFTKYEAMAFETLLRCNNASASVMAKLSKVPQPKIYETMEKLHQKQLISIFTVGKKKIYKINAKYKIIDFFEKIRKTNNLIQDSINSEIEQSYNQDIHQEIPFIGVTGENEIKEELISLMEQAKEEILIMWPEKLYDTEIYSHIYDLSKKIKIKILFDEIDSIKNIRNMKSQAELYLTSGANFNMIGKYFAEINKKLPLEHNQNFGFNLIKNIMSHLGDIFGLCVIDKKMSLFLIPIPISVRIGIVSALPEMIKMHNDGMKTMIETAKLID